MKTTFTTLATFAIGGAFLAGCKGPSSGPVTPAGSPGTGTNVPMNNTPGLAGTGEMAPANRGTDTRTRVDEGTDAGVTGAGAKEVPYAPPSVQQRLDQQDRARTQTPSDRQVQPGTTPQPRAGEPTTRPPTPAPLPRGTPPTTGPTTNPTTR
jgi:hypothetical protein